MKIIGWRTAAYAGGVIGSSALLVLVPVLWPGERTSTIHQGFYQAAAQIIPILLLALIVRISTMRDVAFASHGKIERLWGELLGGIAKERAQFEQEGVEGEAIENLDRLEAEAKANQTAPDKSTSKLSEVMTGAMFATLVLGAIGIGTVLTALAKGSDTEPLFIATLLSLLWVVFGMVVLEVLYFLLSGSLKSE